MRDIIITSQAIDGGFRYEFIEANGDPIYDTNIIREPADGIHLLAHMADKTWLDRDGLSLLAALVCNDLNCWK